jgi:hypothetical protein
MEKRYNQRLFQEPTDPNYLSIFQKPPNPWDTNWLGAPVETAVKPLKIGYQREGFVRQYPRSYYMDFDEFGLDPYQIRILLRTNEWINFAQFLRLTPREFTGLSPYPDIEFGSTSRTEKFKGLFARQASLYLDEFGTLERTPFLM